MIVPNYDDAAVEDSFLSVPVAQRRSTPVFATVRLPWHAYVPALLTVQAACLLGSGGRRGLCTVAAHWGLGF
jgi:hypothetical protein